MSKLKLSLLLVALLRLMSSPLRADDSNLDLIVDLIQSATIKVQFCSASSERTDCERLASAISSNSTTRLSPVSVVGTRNDSAFQNLGGNCPNRGGGITSEPLALFDLEAHKVRTSAFGPFSTFDLSPRYSAWHEHVLVLAEGFASDVGEYDAGSMYSWVVPYVLPAGSPCNGREIGAFFVGDNGQPTSSIQEVDLVNWQGKLLLVTYQSQLGLGYPIYVTVYPVSSDPTNYIQDNELLSPVLAFTADK